MQEIRAIIRPNKLDNLRETLRSMPDFPGLSVAKIEGFTAPKLISKQSAAEQLLDFSPKLLLSVVATDTMTPLIVQTIVQQCTTGQTGDGLVWTTTVSNAVKIKNGASLDEQI